MNAQALEYVIVPNLSYAHGVGPSLIMEAVRERFSFELFIPKKEFEFYDTRTCHTYSRKIALHQ